MKLADETSDPSLESSQFARWYAGLLYQMIETARVLQASDDPDEQTIASNVIGELAEPTSDGCGAFVSICRRWKPHFLSMW